MTSYQLRESDVAGLRRWNVPILLAGLLLLPLLAAAPCAAQATAAPSTDKTTVKDQESLKGFTFYEFLGGSFYSGGHVTELETTVGYNFNNYVGVDVGIPAYFVGGQGIVITPKGLRKTDVSGNEFGDVYADLLVTVDKPVLTYMGSLRGTAPTGSRRDGFSTGRATFDWDNYFDHDFGRVRPFGDVGLADTISNTHFFFRPFTTFGLVALLEGGATVRIVPKLRVGASAYDDAPIGTQRVFIYSKTGEHEFVGPSSIDSDHGYSAWATVYPSSFVALEAGYDHSVRYKLDTFSFGIGLNVVGAYRKARHLL